MDRSRVVFFKYSLRDHRGRQLESSEGKEVSVIEGKGQVIKPVEEFLATAKPGDRRRLSVAAVDGFGEYKDSLVFELSKDKIKSDVKEDDWIRLKMSDGNTMNVQVVDFKDEVCIVDGNHPFAGLDLEFDIEVTAVRSASQREVTTGRLDMGL